MSTNLVSFDKDPQQPMLFFDIPTYVKIDDWIEREEDKIFKSIDKAIILPIRQLWGSSMADKQDLDYFCLSPKRCYAKEDVREHICKYMNYFERFYDQDKELVTQYAYIKYSMDFYPEYNKQNLIDDIKRRILFNPSILGKLHRLNNDNYMISLEPKKGKSIASLQYNTRHGKILMQMSLLMDMVIPLVCHFAYNNPISIDTFLLEVFDIILFMSYADIYSKFYETATTEIGRNETIHSGLWAMQDIRGKDGITHSQDSIMNIILNIMPKYTYDRNVVSFNFASIRNSTGYQVLDIEYEFKFALLSSSNRDVDNNSEFDKFEAALVQQDEALYLQNKCNAEQTLNSIFEQFGPYDEDEFEFYKRELQYENGTVYNQWQKEKIFNLFYKYFGDPVSIKSINQDDYVKLVITAKRILESYNMVILPEIFAGKVVRVPHRKSINKKILLSIESDPLWKMVQENYAYNQKVLDEIKSQIGIILSSEFKIISYDNPELHNKTMVNIPEYITAEYLMFILMI